MANKVRLYDLSVTATSSGGAFWWDGTTLAPATVRWWDGTTLHTTA